MFGKAEIPDLRLERLQGLIESFTTAPNLVLTKLFGAPQNEDSDTVKWEATVGNRGMTPFVAPGSPAPSTAPVGISQHSAMAAYWKEKLYLDEVQLNNLRQPGTTATYWAAKQRLARETLMLRNRSDRRKEWMFAKMLTAGSFSYLSPGSAKVSVDYGIPSGNKVTLGATRKWASGSNRNIVEDIFDAKLSLSNSIGAEIDWALLTTEVLKYMVLDKGIQSLLAKSAFGNGDLLANPVGVLGNLLKIPNFKVYDEQYQVTAWLTAAVTGSSTTVVYVDDAADFVVGGTLRFWDISAGTYEDELITAVDPDAGTVTVSSAPTASFKAGEDKVTMTIKYIPSTTFTMFASSVEGQAIGAYKQAPFGLDRMYGLQVDSKPEWDPDGIWIRVQDKGLPILYNKDAVYILFI